MAVTILAIECQLTLLIGNIDILEIDCSVGNCLIVNAEW